MPVTLKILAVIPSGYCFGLQNLTLSVFSERPPWVRAHFLTTYWTDGELNRQLDKLGITRSSTWLGMFSRRLDLRNLKMSLACLIRLPQAWLAFVRLYRALQPDVVYLANHHEAILLWPVLVWVRRKVVCHMHDPPPDLPFQRVSFRWWRRAVGRFLFVSKSARERLERLGPLANSDRVIHNGVAVQPLARPRRRTDRFTRMFDWPDDAIIVGITGQLNANKGHADLLAAAAIVCRGSSPLVRFVIGGRGPPAYIADLNREIAECRLQDRVGLSGWAERASDFYEAIDVLVLASRHEEGFGLVLAEAGERGLAVIATASGGATEVVRDHITGIIVSKGNPRELADAISRLTRNSTMRDTMGRAARDHISENFNLISQSHRIFAALAPPLSIAGDN